ncbi:MAG: uncharacterized membrane protein YsdA (DUF1294 family) [Candidatus Azotimanducaceae bacterium]|jgi:uncharacterized membrane protein YsdA (DUF1294 family)
MQRHVPILVCCILPLLGIYELSFTIPWQFILTYGLLISITTFGSYWQDKRRAQKDLWRIPEKSLHTFELLGGWLAAYVAQLVFRHKTSKRSYRIVFWGIVGLHQFLALEWITDWRISRAVISLF